MTLVSRMRDALVRGTFGADRTPSAPQIPSPGPDPASHKRTLDAIKQVIDMREGTSGSPLDQHITVRDLLETGLAQLLLPNGTTIGPGASADSGLIPVGGSTSDGSSSTAFFDDPRPVYSTPPAPTNLSVSGAFTNVIVTWDLVDFQNFSYTEVWRATTNSIGSASKIGTSTARLYVDDSAVLGTGYYYWVRAVGVLTSGGTATGPYNAVSGVGGGRLYVGGSDISSLTIQAGNLANGSVTGPALAANSIAVGTAAIQNGAIVNAMIANLAVDNAKIASLDGAKINAGTITASQIASGTITGGNIAGGTITGGLIAANTIAGSNIIGGTITAAQMQTGTITAASGILGNASVNTLQLAGQAVTIPVSGQNPSSIGITTTEQTILSLTISSSGAPITVQFGCPFAASTNTGTVGVTVKIYVDSTVLLTTTVYVAASGVGSIANFVSSPLQSTPGAGSHTYKMTAYASNTGVISFVASGYLLETKK